MQPKIATCNYCGTRAALVLSGTDTHELACRACGAPLHELKSLPVAPAAEARGPVARKGRRPKPPPYMPDRPAYRPRAKRKSRGKLSRKLLSKAFDVLEDIFD